MSFMDIFAHANIIRRKRRGIIPVKRLNGNAGNDTLGGGAGNDTIFGGAGDDVYLFSPGDGFDVIFDTSGFDTLSILNAITLSDLVFTQVGNDLQIDIASGVTITDFYSGDPNLILEQIQFSDGTSFDLTTLLAPVAQDDAFVADQDTVVTGNVLADNGNGVDSDPDGDALSVAAETIVTTNGSVIIATNGDFTYTPNAGYSGIDSFTYTLQDSFGATDTALASITINAPANNSPAAVDDSFFGNEDAAITGDVLSNDTDTDGDNLAVSIATNAANGLLVVNSDNTISYTPNANYNGTDSFTYSVSDGNGGTSVATVNLTIDPVNDVPVSVIDVVSINEDSIITIDVLGNDSDVDGDDLNITSVIGAVNGAVVINADNTLTYTPNADFNGSETLTYTVDDGNGGIVTQNVDITINPINDAPIAQDDIFNMLETVH